MDWTQILVAVIAGLCSAFCAVLANKKSQAVFEQSVKDRLDAVEHKLDVHNGYAEKLGEMQTDIAVIRTEIKHLSEKLP